MFNTELQHVGILWIKKKLLEYDVKNLDWMTGGPWYNTYICKEIHRNAFEEFITNTRTDIYNIMCYIDAHEK